MVKVWESMGKYGKYGKAAKITCTITVVNF